MQDLAGLGAKEGPPRDHPGVSPEHVQFVKRRVTELRKMSQEGGLEEASIRVMIYIAQAQGGIDERSFNLIRRLRSDQEHVLTLSKFKRLVRQQAMVMVVDPSGSIQAIPDLLAPHTEKAIRDASRFVEQVALASGTLNAEGKRRLKEVLDLYDLAARNAKEPEQAHDMLVERATILGQKAHQSAMPEDLVAPQGELQFAQPGAVTSSAPAQSLAPATAQAKVSAVTAGSADTAAASTTSASATVPVAKVTAATPKARKAAKKVTTTAATVQATPPAAPKPALKVSSKAASKVTPKPATKSPSQAIKPTPGTPKPATKVATKATKPATTLKNNRDSTRDNKDPVTTPKNQTTAVPKSDVTPSNKAQTAPATKVTASDTSEASTKAPTTAVAPATVPVETAISPAPISSTNTVADGVEISKAQPSADLSSSND